MLKGSENGSCVSIITTEPKVSLSTFLPLLMVCVGFGEVKRTRYKARNCFFLSLHFSNTISHFVSPSPTKASFLFSPISSHFSYILRSQTVSDATTVAFTHILPTKKKKRCPPVNYLPLLRKYNIFKIPQLLVTLRQRCRQIPQLALPAAKSANISFLQMKFPHSPATKSGPFLAQISISSLPTPLPLLFLRQHLSVSRLRTQVWPYLLHYLQRFRAQRLSLHLQQPLQALQNPSPRAMRAGVNRSWTELSR